MRIAVFGEQGLQLIIHFYSIVHKIDDRVSVQSFIGQISSLHF